MSATDKYLQRLIKSHLQASDGDRNVSGFPDVEDYTRFIQGSMDASDETRMLSYLSAHPEAALWVAAVRDDYSQKEVKSQRVPLGLELKAKNLLYSKKNSEGKSFVNFIYLMVAIAAFVLSFVLKRYFVQCLAVSVVMAFKWIIEEKSRKTQILIYKSIQETQNQPNSPDLHPTKSDL